MLTASHDNWGLAVSGAKHLFDIYSGSPQMEVSNAVGIGLNWPISTDDAPCVENGTPWTHSFY